MKHFIRVIIPALNEENSIDKVINEIPKGLAGEIIVVDNGSMDDTANRARRCGATVLHEPAKGYGNACLKGIDYLRNHEEKTDIVVFLDADYSDHPGEMRQLVAPMIHGNYDFVVGSRVLGNKEKGAMLPQQLFGNWLATTLLRLIYGIKFTDLGPFRAIKFAALLEMDMQDKTYGWTVEMQLKAVKNQLKCMEVPVNYRKRIGHSKISGTIRGSLMAGYKIIGTIFKYI